MNNEFEIIIKISCLILSLYYFSITNNKLLKYSILCYLLSISAALIKHYFEIRIGLGYSFLLFLIGSIVLLWIHTYKEEKIESLDKTFIRVFTLPMMLDVMALLIFKSLSVLGLFFSIVSLGILVFYTIKYKDSDYLTEELRIMNLFGINLVLGLVRVVYVLYN
ncbi:MAG: hypothetical protein U0U66_03955 [Cytophagaceae bacterium]